MGPGPVRQPWYHNALRGAASRWGGSNPGTWRSLSVYCGLEEESRTQVRAMTWRSSLKAPAPPHTSCATVFPLVPANAEHRLHAGAVLSPGVVQLKGWLSPCVPDIQNLPGGTQHSPCRGYRMRGRGRDASRSFQREQSTVRKGQQAEG